MVVTLFAVSTWEIAQDDARLKGMAKESNLLLRLYFLNDISSCFSAFFFASVIKKPTFSEI